MQPETLRRFILFGGGVVLILVGIPMLLLPGPGILAILAGAGMIWKGLSERRERL
ncbi:hypothetical protein GF324_09765 [bacterium]|nr:hypothetical protein [bacterium]